MLTSQLILDTLEFLAAQYATLMCPPIHFSPKA